MSYKGIHNLELDLPSQVEYNRKTGAENKQAISTLQDQVNQLLSQAPAGFLPQVYYGLTRGEQKYRFNTNYIITAVVPGNVNDAYEFISNEETEDYINAIGVKISDNQIQIIVRGDYNVNSENFTLINTRTGETTTLELENVLTLQDASYLGQFSAQNNKEKQITALKDLEYNRNNVVFASIDRNADGVYNWVRIGGYINGKDGYSIFAATAITMESVLSAAKSNDLIVIGETFTYNNVSYAVGNLYRVVTLSPLSLELRGNIRGAKGNTGETGQNGQDGADGYTPYIQDGYWYINGNNTGVQAIGQDGADGQDGQAFSIQSGLYSTPANYGQSGNVDPESNDLLQLPTLPQSNISGKGYVVYDPLTTPLDPFYDLYFANNGDVSWTIIHPFSGIRGQDGSNGYTPYIQDGYWWINNVNTGVQATGPQGVQGPIGLEGLSIYTSSANITNSTSTILASTVTVPTGRAIKIKDLIMGTNGGLAQVTAISGDSLTLTLSYYASLVGPQGTTGQTGATGANGVGIQSVVAGTSYISGTKTITPITITLTNTNQTTVNVEAENGSGGGTMYQHIVRLQWYNSNEGNYYYDIWLTIYSTNDIGYNKNSLKQFLANHTYDVLNKYMNCSGYVSADPNNPYEEQLVTRLGWDDSSQQCTFVYYNTNTAQHSTVSYSIDNSGVTVSDYFAAV